jgi:hypothetical protein
MRESDYATGKGEEQTGERIEYQVPDAPPPLFGKFGRVRSGKDVPT